MRQGWSVRSACRLAAAVGMAAALAAAAALGGCDSTQRARARGEARPVVLRDIPDALRGTIGAEAQVRGGADPVLLTGIGLVVGLNGTGSSEAPDVIRGYLEREMALRGVGQESMGTGDLTPDRLLASRDTAIVAVQAVVSPAAPRGARFDVLVAALPNTSTTSLEGGILWTTDLSPGLVQPGGPTARRIAQARGTLFLNPFDRTDGEAAPGGAKTTARVLHGGVMTEPLEMLLSLDNPSHLRARAVTEAINTKFPQGPGDLTPIAKGRDEEQIAVVVPAAYRERPQEFLLELLSTQIDQTFMEERARRLVEALAAQPGLASEIGAALQAIGPLAIPSLRTLYTSGDTVPRLTALRAGARLGDAATVEPLLEIAREGAPGLRVDAIALLADMPINPRIDETLKVLVDDQTMTVRVAAYEGLAKRRSAAVSRVGVDGKFVLDVVDSERPLIWVSQQGQPRIAVFGREAEIERPTLVFAWDDRFILTSDSPSDQLRVMHRDERTGEVMQGVVDQRLPKFIEYVAHTNRPEEPWGLGMSYSQVVDLLYELTDRQKAVAAGFVTERDTLAAGLLAAAPDALAPDRPELSGDDSVDWNSMLGIGAATDKGKDAMGDAAPPPTPAPEAAPAPGRSKWVTPIQPAEGADPKKAREEAERGGGSGG